MGAARVVVVGDLIYDVLAELEGPLVPGADTFAPVHAQPGGSGANAAAWLARLGMRATLVARIGDDPLGGLLEEELTAGRVECRLTRDAGKATGKVVVLVDESGEPTMITSTGAGENLRPEDLPEDVFGPDVHLHLSGYLFSGGPRRETALEALRRARRSGMTVSVDPSAVALLRRIGPESFLRWTRDVDLCFPNREEGALLTGTEDPDRILDVLLEHYPRVVLKLGPGGAVYTDRERRIRLPAPPTRVVGTTGAGDALCAAFLAAWLGSEGPEEALRRGVGLAARVVGQIGGRPGA